MFVDMFLFFLDKTIDLMDKYSIFLDKTSNLLDKNPIYLDILNGWQNKRPHRSEALRRIIMHFVFASVFLFLLPLVLCEVLYQPLSSVVLL